jgi:ADP-ribosyl-[dinitrogen reductase] hydrolase
MGRRRDDERTSIATGLVPGDVRARFRGCLLGGAIGDALGAPVEFLDRDAIRAAHGTAGVTGFAPAYGLLGAITDDTQMTLFTAEALLRWRVTTLLGVEADPTTLACSAYLRWLATQRDPRPAAVPRDEGLLLAEPGLHAIRGPGTTCLEALSARRHASAEPARNDRKGCGGVMRIAPVGLAHVDGVAGRADPVAAFELGVRFAALTHGHPTGSLAAGALALLVSQLALGAPLGAALDAAIRHLDDSAGDAASETVTALRDARRLADQGDASAAAVESLGAGWIAEEALAIGVYAALAATSFADGVLLAVNHAGDSDSTGAIAGNLLGTLHGVEAIPVRWRQQVGLGDLTLAVADDLYAAPSWTRADAERLRGRYPPR